jgi:hypothetical protein
VSDLPTLAIDIGEKHTIDLYYALPERMSRAQDLPQFALSWHIGTPLREVAEDIHFERAAAAAQLDRSDYDGQPESPFNLGTSPMWWYDPDYLVYGFAHSAIVHSRHPEYAHDRLLAPRRVRAPGARRGYLAGGGVYGEGTIHARR